MRRKEEPGTQTPFDIAITDYLQAARRASNNLPTSGNFLPARSESLCARDQARWHGEAVKAGAHLMLTAHSAGKSAEDVFGGLAQKTMIDQRILKPLADALILLKGARFAGKLN